MKKINKETDLLIEELNKIEKDLDSSLANEDYTKYNFILDSRMKTFKKLENFFDDENVQNILKKIIKKDEERKKVFEIRLSKLKNEQMNLQKGKNAIKKGYYNVQEGLRRKKIDKSG